VKGHRFHRTDAVQTEIVTGLRGFGCSVIVANAEVDLIVGYAGLTFLFECKTRGGKLSGSQRLMIKRWKGHYAVVHDLEEAIRSILLTCAQWKVCLP
jgi:hypothetical protein